MNVAAKTNGMLMWILLMAVLLTGCAWSAPPTTKPLDEKIGQMLMGGFRGLTVDESHFIVRDIRRCNLGGVILFDYDVIKKVGRRGSHLKPAGSGIGSWGCIITGNGIMTRWRGGLSAGIRSL